MKIKTEYVGAPATCMMCFAHREQPETFRPRGDRRVEAFEIHNRFCGENGEPCQVCRLMAAPAEEKQ